MDGAKEVVGQARWLKKSDPKLLRRGGRTGQRPEDIPWMSCRGHCFWDTSPAFEWAILRDARLSIFYVFLICNRSRAKRRLRQARNSHACSSHSTRRESATRKASCPPSVKFIQLPKQVRVPLDHGLCEL